jgi:hypothetical protein
MIAIGVPTKQMHRKVISIDPELDVKKGRCYFVAVVFTAAAGGLRSVAKVL